jgi:hypothetical protein
MADCRSQVISDYQSAIRNLKFAICDPEGHARICGLAALAGAFFVTIFVVLRLEASTKKRSMGS